MSAAIRWQTRSRYSHAAILLPDEQTIVEAWPGAGVHAKIITDWTGVERFQVRTISRAGSEALMDFLVDQLGMGYDYKGVLRFLSRDPDIDQVRKCWFCSELVYAAYQAADVNLFNDSESWEISPGMLARSPLLELIPNP